MQFGGWLGGQGFEGGEEERVCGAVAAEGVGEEVVPGAEHRGAGEKDEDFDADELGERGLVGENEESPLGGVGGKGKRGTY